MALSSAIANQCDDGNGGFTYQGLVVRHRLNPIWAFPRSDGLVEVKVLVLQVQCFMLPGEIVKRTSEKVSAGMGMLALSAFLLNMVAHYMCSLFPGRGVGVDKVEKLVFGGIIL
ncbi:uncharacterized protein LDX57_011722 [Aspergillus melleus]|uniref:uncharacterized protein n=1 Tax=Aspergillus melleus TaxID=138277 RepID=UPI001E8D185A|nr:uncharacterized protein LDX57_011722 [Aspergillus melleus]KAH8434084.1 hypothetical protein LDX57_011722 [Aspergillus melleus]